MTTIAVNRTSGARRRPPQPRQIAAYVILTLVALLVAFPLLLALSYSFMSERDIVQFPPPILPANPTFANYDTVLNTIPIGRYLLNSFVVSAAVLRHFQADPLLPDEVLPPGWPGPALRDDYDRFDRAYRALLREYFRIL